MLDVSSDKFSEKIKIKEIDKSKVINSSNISQNKMVRTDSSEQKIDKFLNTSNTNMSLLSKAKTDDVIVR